MALTPGTRLGAYEILSSIGVGGMGEVYCATDTSLKRQVALKVLPPDVADNPERIARFQREAEVLAALNHPNIAHLYGIDRSSSTPALVMELVEGPTLADRLATGPLPIDEALAIARQIAEALEAAHEQGIVHRDLKPANVKVKDDGMVKVLDFGLAKALESPRALASGNATQSPTITTPAMMTSVGMILGTAAYMSPEQAKGRPVDKRSDVWAFGCVLFEMLSGKRPFDGDDVGDVLASILKTEPDWTRLPSATPAAVSRLIRDCLAKDRLRRPGDIAVARYVLRGGVDQPAAAVTRLPSRARSAAAIAVLLAAAVGIAAGAVWSSGRRPAAPPLVAHFVLPVGAGSALGVGARPLLAFSPDGTKVAYVANGTLFLRELSEFDAHQIPGVESKDNFAGALSHPAFSPDGRSLAFYSLLDNTIKRVAVTGGTPLTLCRVENPFGLSWSGDTLVFGEGRDGVFRVPAAGGSPEQIAKVDGDEVADAPQLLPDGSLLFSIAKGLNRDRWDKAQIVVQSADGTRTTIINGGSDGRYVATGHLLYALGGTMFAVPFDVAHHKTSGVPTPVIEGVRRSLSAGSGVAQVAVSLSGSLVYIAGPSASVIQRSLVYSDVDGGSARLPLPPAQYQHPRVSRNGKTLAIEKDEGADADVWIYDLSGASQIRRLTFGGHNRFPIWAGDNQRVAFQSDRAGGAAIFAQRADVSGADVDRLTTAGTGEIHMPESWSPDGRTLLYSVLKDGTYTLFALSLDTRKAVEFGGIKSAEPIGATFSPDGRWVAYSQNDRAGGTPSPNRGVYVQPFPPTGERYQVPKQRLDFHPAWAPNGSQLLFVPTVGRFTTVTLRTKPTVTFTDAAERPVTVSHDRVSTEIRDFDVTPEGRLLLTTVGDDRSPSASAPQLRVMLNWFEELRQRAPIK